MRREESIITSITNGAPINADEVRGKNSATDGRNSGSRSGAKLIARPASIPQITPVEFVLGHQIPSRNAGKIVFPAIAKAKAAISAIIPHGLKVSNITTRASIRKKAFAAYVLSSSLALRFIRRG